MNQQHGERMTVHDAARRLGISEDAVRMRVKRKTLAAEREGGRLYVLLEPDPTTDPTDRTAQLVDELRNRIEFLEGELERRGTTHDSEADRYTKRLEDDVDHLRQQLAQEQEARNREQEDRTEERRRHDTLMAQLTQANAALAARIPELEAPPMQEPTESPETVEEAPEASAPRSDTAEAHSEAEATERPWWRRMFGW